MWFINFLWFINFFCRVRDLKIELKKLHACMHSRFSMNGLVACFSHKNFSAEDDPLQLFLDSKNSNHSLTYPSPLADVQLPVRAQVQPAVPAELEHDELRHQSAEVAARGFLLDRALRIPGIVSVDR